MANCWAGAWVVGFGEGAKVTPPQQEYETT